SRLVGDQNVDAYGSRLGADGAASIVREPCPGPLYLPGARPALQLPVDLAKLRQARGPDGMAPGDQASAGVDRQPAADAGGILIHQSRTFARTAQKQPLIKHELAGGGRVMKFHQ